jgi:hypothetical protein
MLPMRFSRSMFAVLGVALAAPAAHAQQWSSPLFSSPLAKPKWEIITSDAYGAGVGLTVAARPFASAPGLRLRLGVADGLGTGPLDAPGPLSSPRETYAFSAGLDYSAPLAADAQGRLRADWVAGAGVAVNGSTVLSVPLGISIGYQGDRIRPYVTPRIVLERRLDPVGRTYGDPGVRLRDNAIHAGAVVDWGVDVPLRGSGMLRLALTTGSWKGIGLGFSF